MRCRVVLLTLVNLFSDQRLLRLKSKDHLLFRVDFHSSDTGDFGINTPLYFCLDQFGDMYTGLEKLANRPEISIYPNPAKEQIQLRVNGHLLGYEILDMSGKKLMVGNENTIDISALPAGIYIMQLQVGDAFMHQKFIKE